jgi:dihydroorotate dehydrogenase
VLYASLFRPLLFALSRRDPETVHEATLRTLQLAGATPPLLALLRLRYTFRHQSLGRTVAGIAFPNPLGLAAGMDKNGIALPAWEALGFGSVEVGTVTALPQPGNPRPRLFRLPQDQALINRMGFNNAGAAALAQRLAHTPKLGIPVGISLGKSKLAPFEQAAEDYCTSLGFVYRHGDYFAVNVSSPNTPGLRGLQEKGQLDELLGALRRKQRELAGAAQPKPLFVKVAPDLSDGALDDVLQVCAAHQIDGLIATNTTIMRPNLRSASGENGGLSGRPLAPRALEMVRFISRQTNGALPIIGVGGIFAADDAQRLLDAGASLLQIYTGFVYAGPSLPSTICRGLVAGEGVNG